MTRVSETPMQGKLNDVFKVKLNFFIGCQCIGESIERLLQLLFEASKAIKTLLMAASFSKPCGR
jgi:hypothetical protein